MSVAIFAISSPLVRWLNCNNNSRSISSIPPLKRTTPVVVVMVVEVEVEVVVIMVVVVTYLIAITLTKYNLFQPNGLPQQSCL